MKSSNRDGIPGFIRIGTIVGAAGLKGVVKVVQESEMTLFFSAGTCLKTRGRDGSVGAVKILWAKPGGRNWRLALDGVNDRDQAESLVGSALFFRKTDLPEPEPGSHYWFQLIGLKVQSETGEWLGTIEDIMATGANDVYVVRDGDRETLLPAISSVVRSVDLAAGIMRVEVPEGL